MLLTFQCINSRTIEWELFLSIALNIARESGRTIGSGLLGEVGIFGGSLRADPAQMGSLALGIRVVMGRGRLWGSAG